MTIASRSAAARAVAASHATHVSMLLSLLLLSFSPSAAFASTNSRPIKRVVVVGGVSVPQLFLPDCDTFVLTANVDILSLYPSSSTPRRMGMSTRAFGASRLLITRRRQNILRWKYQLSLATPRHIGPTSDSSTLI